MAQVYDTSDLHDLVTLDPTFRDLPPSVAPSFLSSRPGLQQHQNRRLSSHLLSSLASAASSNESRAGIPSASGSQRSGTRWPFSSMTPREAGSAPRRQAHRNSLVESSPRPSTSGSTHFGMDGQTDRFPELGRSQPSIPPPTIVLDAQKDVDDVDDLSEMGRRRGLVRRDTATSTRVNRLFAMHSSPTPSREPSFQKESSQTFNTSYVRSQPGETASLPHHLLDRGLLQGKHSDITVKVFDKKYKLHRIVLDRAPFFESALSPPWCEASQREVELHPEEIDTNITQRAFELALKRLYGCSLRAEEDEEAVCLFATGCWLEMQDLINDSMTAIMKMMRPPNLASVIQVVSANYYGKPGDRILESAKAMLCRNGADTATSAWDGVPTELVRELVGSDGFFVQNEWDRWRFAKRLLDRRLKAVARDAGLWDSHSCQAPEEIRGRAVRPKPAIVEEAMSRISKEDAPTWRLWEALYGHAEVRPLLGLLDDDIHYVHMDFEQLQSVRGAKDVLGVPLLMESTIQDALWGNLELRQKVLNAGEADFTLGLLQHSITQMEADYGDTAGDRAESSSSRIAIKTSPYSGIDQTRSRGLSGAVRQYPIPIVDRNIVLGGEEEPVDLIGQFEGPQDPRATSHLVIQPDDHEFEEGLSRDAVRSEESNDATTSTNSTTAPTHSTYPPFRFAVELPSARFLKDGRKVFSHTVFYAGSHWNVYVKKVKKGTKNPHLGVYLHRAPQQLKTTSMTPLVHGSVDRRIGALEHRMQVRRPPPSHLYPMPHGPNPYNSIRSNWALPDPQGHTPSRAPQLPQRAASSGSSAAFHHPAHNVTNFSSSSSASSSDSTSDNADSVRVSEQSHMQQVPALSPYVDKRPTIKTYFKIYSPSRGGRMLSIYESVPCEFNYSQSWGWKSSTLMADDENEEDDEGLVGAVSDTLFLDDAEAKGGKTKDYWKMDMEAVKESGTKRRGRGYRFIVVLGVV